jgi:ADP-heptose:LPS heptosyltransferase
MTVSKVIDRIGHVAWWRYVRWAHPIADRLAARWGLASRLVRWPIPALVPFHRHRLHVVRLGALGDILMCTPALQELKQRNPTCHLTLYTDFRDLAATFPFIDQVRPTSEAPPDAIWLNYEKSIPPRRHIARILGDHLGFAVSDVRPTCVVDRDLFERFRRDFSGRPRPVIVVNRRAGPHTPNKDWPAEYWDDLVRRLAGRATVIDVGGQPSDPVITPAGSYLDLRGQTTLPELIAVIAAADLHIAPITGTVHIAAATGVPSVVIYGGYEAPECTAYPGNIGFYSPVECAPCWLREPCPYGRKCLSQITRAQVEAAVDQLWNSRRQALYPV